MYSTLNQYLNPTILEFVDLPDEFLASIGVGESSLSVDEIITEGLLHSDTVFDPVAGESVTFDWAEAEVARSTTVTLSLLTSKELALNVPGVQGIELLLPASDISSISGYGVTLAVSEDGSYKLAATICLKIRFQKTLLKPVRKKAASGGKTAFEADDSAPEVQVEIAAAKIEYDFANGLTIEAKGGLTIDRPAMIGDTGIVIESADLVLSLSGNGPKPQGTPDGWSGLLINEATLWFPDVVPGPIVATGFGIGSGGVSGTITKPFALSYSKQKKFQGDLIGEVFGMKGGIEDISLTLQQNIPVSGGIKAKVLLPFFEDTDTPLDLEFGFALDGSWSAAIQGANGICELKKPDVLSLKVEKIGLEVEDDTFTVKLSGEVRPLVAGLDWPSFKSKSSASILRKRPSRGRLAEFARAIQPRFLWLQVRNHEARVRQDG